MPVARTNHLCKRCNKTCPGFRRAFCSIECERITRAAAARARREVGTQLKICVVCRNDFAPNGTQRTCSKPCSESFDKQARKDRNARYHHDVRKKGLVRTFTDWAASKKGELAAQVKARREADPKRARAIGRASRARHRDTAIARTKAWKTANPDRVKQHRATDYARNTARFRKHNLLRKLRLKDNGSDLSKATDIFELLVRHGTSCAYCGGSTEGRRQRHLDHVVPIARGGPDILENVVIACARCNRDKWHQDPVEWIQRQGHLDSFASRFPNAWSRLLRWKSGRDALPFDPPGFLTIAEAAPFFGVSVRTLRRRISAGLLRCERRGRGPNALICFKREDVEADSGVKACWNAGTRAWVPIL